MAGIERKTTITSSKADTRKQTVKLNKGNPPLSRHPPYLCALGRINFILWLWWPPLRDLSVGVHLDIRLHFPGRVPGFSPWSSPVLPSISLSFLYLIF